MIQAIILGLVGIVTLYSLSKLDKISEKSFKIFSAIAFLSTVLFAYIEFQNDKYREKVNLLTLKFTQDENLSCGDYTVNNSSFNITSNSFVAKKDSKYRGVILPFTLCETK